MEHHTWAHQVSDDHVNTILPCHWQRTLFQDLVLALREGRGGEGRGGEGRGGEGRGGEGRSE